MVAKVLALLISLPPRPNKLFLFKPPIYIYIYIFLSPIFFKKNPTAIVQLTCSYLGKCYNPNIYIYIYFETFSFSVQEMIPFFFCNFSSAYLRTVRFEDMTSG